MSTVKNKNSLRTNEAQSAQKPKNNEARPKFTGSYIKKKKQYSLSIQCPPLTFESIAVAEHSVCPDELRCAQAY